MFVHPTAVVDEGATLGDGTKIWHFVQVSTGARIGASCSLGQNVFVGKDVRVGNGVRIQNNVSLYEGVEIEDEVFLGPLCVFTNVINPRAFCLSQAGVHCSRACKWARASVRTRPWFAASQLWALLLLSGRARW